MKCAVRICFKLIAPASVLANLDFRLLLPSSFLTSHQCNKSLIGWEDASCLLITCVWNATQCYFLLSPCTTLECTYSSFNEQAEGQRGLLAHAGCLPGLHWGSTQEPLAWEPTTQAATKSFPLIQWLKWSTILAKHLYLYFMGQMQSCWILNMHVAWQLAIARNSDWCSLHSHYNAPTTLFDFDRYISLSLMWVRKLWFYK